MSKDGAYWEGEEALQRIRTMSDFTPQCRALGIEVVSIRDGAVRARVPYKPEIAGDPDTGVIAGGVITTFLDHVCGMATFIKLSEPTPIATIDLRIDYMRAAAPGRAVLAEAFCHKVGRNVAFVRAVAFEDEPSNPVAHATATFMVNPTAARKMGANLRERRK